MVTIALVLAACIVGCARQPTWLGADPMQIVPETAWNMYRAIPAACFAAAFALNVGIRPARWRTTSPVAIGGAVLCAACVFVQFRFGPFPLLRSASGFGLALVAFSTFDHRLLRPIAWMGRLSFGVYLSHVVFIRLAMLYIGEQAAMHNVAAAWCIGIFAFAAGILFSALVSTSRYTRWIIGCETESRRKPIKIAATSVEPAAATTTASAV